MAITGTAGGISPAKVGHRDRELERVRHLADVMDHKLVDPLMGLLLPGIGDVIGGLIGFYIVVVAWRRKVSPVLIARMILNLGFDMTIGLVPLLGDVFDFAFKSNVRNVDVLLARPTGKATAKDWVIVGAAALGYLAIMALVIWGVIALFRHL